MLISKHGSIIILTLIWTLIIAIAAPAAELKFEIKTTDMKSVQTQTQDDTILKSQISTVK